MQSSKIGIVGFGNQGEAWALNLRDSGWNVTLFLRPRSKGRRQAEALGFRTEVIGPKLEEIAVLALLIPDDAMPEFCSRYKIHLKPGQSLLFAHGFTLHYQTAAWPNETDWILVAPKGIGTAVRERFIAGSGVPAVLAVANDATRHAWEVANRVAEGIGSLRAGTYRATVREEVEADLFSEQALLTGGLPALVEETYNVLVDRGISPEVAYLECVHELAFMADLFQKRGIHGTLQFASPTAQFGGIQGGRRVISPDVRQNLEDLFEEIRAGTFAGNLTREAETGFPATREALTNLKGSLVEITGRKIRRRIERGRA
ncbi:MAG TPA: ketol-acid reductoisomerase [Bdellovibrionota bacterium]|nr:ketol-acid reductoisomerase [Bdellovibrionota bacterium]